ncbi:DUF418 domain-containing protein [Nonomuraea sp. NN258]|nr:DUF418 domain-containing protein [Nonomuraea antri]
MTGHPADAAALVVDLGFRQRFFPIFCVLFGAGFALFLESAGRRAGRPRLVLLRRLAVLAAFGIAHQLAQPGEALLPYAVFGALVLLPASYLPRAAVPVAGVLATAAALPLGGGLLLIPGLFLLGQAAADYRHVLGGGDVLGGRPALGGRLPVWLLAAGLVTAVPLVLWYLSVPVQQRAFGPGEPIAAAAGLATAAAYTGALLLLLGTRAGAAVARVLAPLGRMALTNYLLATPLVLLAATPLGLTDSAAFGSVFAPAAVIIAAQAAFSAWWLARFRHGPAEWVWRRATWGRPLRNRRTPADAGAPVH